MDASCNLQCPRLLLFENMSEGICLGKGLEKGPFHDLWEIDGTYSVLLGQDAGRAQGGGRSIMLSRTGKKEPQASGPGSVAPKSHAAVATIDSDMILILGVLRMVMTYPNHNNVTVT